MLLAGAAAALIGAAALALLLGGGDSDGDGATAGPPAGAAIGTVERRTLAEQLTATGTIGYAGENTVLARLAGTVTALPAVGGEIRRDGRLYAIDGEPVLLFYGSVPAYRTLAEGVSEGPDVEQLERNLAALGYEPGTVDEEFSANTAAAVGTWQEDHGLEPSGELELGRVAFLRGPQRVTEREATLGEALGGGGGASRMVAWQPEAAGLDEAEAAREPEGKEAQPEPEGKEAQPEPEGKEPQPAEGRGEEPEPEPEPEEESEAEPEAPSVPVLRTSSTRRVVSVELEADQQSIARRGQRVEVVLPGGTAVPGRVGGLAAVEASGGEGGPGAAEAGPGVEATISVAGKHRLPGLDGAAVSVRFTQRVREDVLSVPLTALLATGEDRFAVVAVAGAQRRRIVVIPGLAADGFVEVKGKGLREGMVVETGG